MKKHAAIIGLGQRGQAWANAFLEAGWDVTGFDPDPVSPVFSGAEGRGQWRQEPTISATVRDASWITLCLPERLELLQKVIQRAQAEAPRAAVIGVVTSEFNIEDVQNCALRSEAVVIVSSGSKGAFNCDVSQKTSATTRDIARKTLAGLSTRGALSEPAPRNIFSKPGAKSA